MLGNAVQRTLDLVDSLQGSSQPGLYLVAENNVDGAPGGKGLRRGGQ